jgi:TPR repeat protein
LNAGICLNDGIGGLPMNKSESLVYFNKSCDGKNPIACLKLFKIYLDGNDKVAKDLPRAFEYAKKACDLGDILGCLNTSLMLKKGDGVPVDLKLSEEYKKRAENIRNENSAQEQTSVVFGEQHK